MKITIFWDAVSCSLVEVYQRFRGSKHLWNVGRFLPDYMAQHPRRQSSYLPSLEPETKDKQDYKGVLFRVQ
jgi:hypothetical protein